MSPTRLSKAVLVALMLSVSALGNARSTETSSGGSISVNVNMARILRISAPAATVIIGNPGVADVTIQDPQTLVLTGKSYGETNLIVLDSIGNPIADTMIRVVQGQSDLVTMYLGISRTTFVCAPVCQPTIMLGDDPAYSTQSLASSNLVETAAK